MNKWLFHAPINKYFDVTPQGVIQNRLSKDMNTVDFNFPASQRFFFQSMVSVVIRIGVAAYTVIWIILVLPLLLLFSLYYTKYFIKGLKETWRIESVTNSPLLSHLGETISGVWTIWAFRVEE